MRLVAGRGRLKLGRHGMLRLKATKNVCLTAPIAATVKLRKRTALKSVRYKLDGKRLARSRGLKYGARLRPAKLAPGTHTLKLRVSPRAGAAKTFKVRFRLAFS